MQPGAEGHARVEDDRHRAWRIRRSLAQPRRDDPGSAGRCAAGDSWPSRRSPNPPPPAAHLRLAQRVDAAQEPQPFLDLPLALGRVAVVGGQIGLHGDERVVVVADRVEAADLGHGAALPVGPAVQAVEQLADRLSRLAVGPHADLDPVHVTSMVTIE